MVPLRLIAVRPGDSPQLLLSGDDLADAAAVLPQADPLPVADGIGLVLGAAATAPPGTRWEAARAALARLGEAEQAAALRAIAVANWRQQSRFCPACGAAVEVNPGRDGWRCAAEGGPVFPRTDPCVITAVLDRRDRLLLSHASNHPDGMYTLVAGFVEAGESLEDAVRRETLEEVGVEILALRFLRSQPWPFPGSLMALFAALAGGTRLRVDGLEITAARWFTPAELTAEIDAGRLGLPMPYSVARQTIEAWRAGDLVWRRGNLCGRLPSQTTT
ncbi:MAG: NAD(+) diphosphatase [Bifidobacteriaceae bacterium]|jgi:NAD+ diphosphatase|nr:NAD(+) diphosphatase [Bifidobacteriaceae bacterium]